TIYSPTNMVCLFTPTYTSYIDASITKDNTDKIGNRVVVEILGRGEQQERPYIIFGGRTAGAPLRL
ncbi:MAG: hypothetical protein PUP93_12450, partial [Rhizonema sp. NSF051]|nr:hypothetical protein [Rhizonema sp. NSF051]